MKKKISLIGLIFLLIFSFTGCGSKKSGAADYDQEKMQGYADLIVQSFSRMPDEALDKYEDISDFGLNMTLLQSGLPIEGKNFLTIVEAWKAGVKECGRFESIGKYTLKTNHNGASLSADAKFANRKAELTFTFDEKMNMESMTVNANYSTEEILEKAGLNTILGMGTVFVVLIFISFIISLFKFIPALERKFNKKRIAAKSAPETTSAQAVITNPAAATGTEAVVMEDNGELAAVIAAAIAAAEGTSTDGFIVRSIKRRKSNRWS